MNSLKILVTGATGKVGSRLVPRLARRGYKVRALVRDRSHDPFPADLNVELAVGDLLHPQSLAAALGDIDAIVHLATFYKGATEEQSRMANIQGTETFARAAIETGVKHFIFASSNRVYGSNRGKLVTEDDPAQPFGNKFAIAKVEVENSLVELFSNSNATLSILRLALVYGDDDPHLRETIPELNDWPPAKRVQMLHHADLAQAVGLCISQHAGGIFNVTDDAALTISELRKFHNIPDTRDECLPDPWEMMASNLKIREQLGFRPIYPTFYSARDAGAL